MIPVINPETDIIIAVMGPTGAGKSNLIDKLVGQPTKLAGSSLESETEKVQAFRITRHEQADIVIVDTPGFDDTSRSDSEILGMIDQWLEKAYGKTVKLAGILYLYRISDNRMTEKTHKYLHTFGTICGGSAAERVVLVTSMWDKKGLNMSVAEEREKRLQEKWKNMIDNGSTCKRFLNTPESALDLVNHILKKKEEREMKLLQEEITEFGKKLNEVPAGKELYTVLQKLLPDQERTLRMLAEQNNLKEQLEADLDKIRQDFETITEAARSIKISWTRRIFSFFFRRRSPSPLKLEDLPRSSMQ